MRLVLSVLFLWCSYTLAFAQCDKGEQIVKLITLEQNQAPAVIKSRNQDTVLALQTAWNKELQGQFCLNFVQDKKYANPLGLRALQEGEVTLAVVDFSLLGPLMGDYAVFDMPFAFHNIYDINRFLFHAAPVLQLSLEQNQMQGLAFWHDGFRQIFSKKKILYPEDAAGLKFREKGGALLRQMATVSNGVALAIAGVDRETALQRGRISVLIDNWITIKNKPMTELLNYGAQSNHSFKGAQVLANKVWWAGLSDPIKAKISKLMAAVSQQHNSQKALQQRAAMHELIQSRLHITALTAKQRGAWQTRLAPLWQSLEPRMSGPVLTVYKNTRP